MKDLPPRIKDALDKIRKVHTHYVDIKVINGRCYVYESTSLWDKKSKTIKKITKYIGRITDIGEFVPSMPRRPELSAAILAPAYSSAAPERSKVADKVAAYEIGQKAGKYDNLVLQELSGDGRITLPELGKRIGLSPSGAEWQRNNIEKKYGIRYLAEIDLDKLGYLTYIVMIKFSGEMPAIDEMKRQLSQEKSVQLAMLTQGEYDLILYAVFSKNSDSIMDFYNMRSGLFPDYNMKLYVAPFYQSYSFVPLRSSFFDLLSEKLVVRGKDEPEPRADSLLKREYVLLKELSENGTMDFAKIDEKYSLAEGSARYTYHKLVRSGIIRRITITMENIHLKYISIIFLEKINHTKYMKDRERVMRHIIEDSGGEVINRYALEGDIKLPEGIFFVLPVLKDEDMESTSAVLGRIEGMTMVSVIATHVLVGAFCYRKLDRRYTLQYKILREQYGEKDVEMPIQFDSTRDDKPAA